MARTSKAVYLGNTHDEYCGFTVGKEYEIEQYTNDVLILVVDDDGECRGINNGAFHKFWINEKFDSFVTETECRIKVPAGDKKPYLRYYINEHETDVI